MVQVLSMRQWVTTYNLKHKYLDKVDLMESRSTTPTHTEKGDNNLSNEMHKQVETIELLLGDPSGC